MAAVQIAPWRSAPASPPAPSIAISPARPIWSRRCSPKYPTREIGALRRAADVAPGPLSALSAAIMTFAARALRDRRLTFAAIAEPVDAELDAARLAFRKALAAEFSTRIAAAVGGSHLPEQDAALSARRWSAFWSRGLIGPLAPDAAGRERDVVQSLTLVALARARRRRRAGARACGAGVRIRIGIGSDAVT